LTHSRILLVEDEPEMGAVLTQALSELGFEVCLATDGVDGFAKVDTCDLMIVDVMLPKGDGFELVRRIRSHGHRIPILFLTARDAVKDRVQGFEVGGDDYLLKPFALEELVARIRSLLRRDQERRDTLEIGDLMIDRGERKVRRGTDWIYLSNTEYAILELLARTPGVSVSKPAILRHVWHEDAGIRDENIVEVYIGQLRHKLEVNGRGRLIHTVRGAGYVLEHRAD